jgi:hypothetical protein
MLFVERDVVVETGVVGSEGRRQRRLLLKLMLHERRLCG